MPCCGINADLLFHCKCVANISDYETQLQISVFPLLWACQMLVSGAKIMSVRGRKKGFTLPVFPSPPLQKMAHPLTPERAFSPPPLSADTAAHV